MMSSMVPSASPRPFTTALPSSASAARRVASFRPITAMGSLRVDELSCLPLACNIRAEKMADSHPHSAHHAGDHDDELGGGHLLREGHFEALFEPAQSAFPFCESLNHKSGTAL